MRLQGKTGAGMCTILFATVAGTAHIASAQQTLGAPQPISQPAPAFTANAIGIPTEGWAVVRYSVLTDGSTASVRVVDIVPPSADPGAAIDSVARWRFRPGTENGAAIDWNNNETLVEFQSPAEDSQPPPSFEELYDAIVATIRAQIPTGEGTDNAAIAAYEGAREANLILLQNHATRMDEITLALSQAMYINLYLENMHAAYDFARRLTDPRLTVLTGQDLRHALEQRLQIEATLGRTRDALITFERIAAGYELDETDSAVGFHEQLQNRLDNDEILQAQGYVVDQPWRLDASRMVFTLGHIDGIVNSIAAECDTARIQVDYQPDVDWHLPESLGDCTYFVNAEPKTGFSFYELLPAAD
jgi:hypothetical protein